MMLFISILGFLSLVPRHCPGSSMSFTSIHAISFTGSVYPWYTVTSSLKSNSSDIDVQLDIVVEQMVGWRMVVLGIVVGMALQTHQQLVLQLV